MGQAHEVEKLSDAFLRLAAAHAAGQTKRDVEFQQSAVLELEDISEQVQAPLQKMEHELHSWVAFFIMPIFAFANAGVVLSGDSLGGATLPVLLGIVFGLTLGKPIGIVGASWLAVKSGLFPKPQASWAQIYGVSLLCGIGFTMSLFIGGLAFVGTEMQAEVRLGVLGGSFLSAAAAYFLLKSSGAKR